MRSIPVLLERLRQNKHDDGIFDDGSVELVIIPALHLNMASDNNSRFDARRQPILIALDFQDDMSWQRLIAPDLMPCRSVPRTMVQVFMDSRDSSSSAMALFRA